MVDLWGGWCTDSFGSNGLSSDRTNDKENLTCYNILSGKIIWKFSFASTYRDDFGMQNGPRSTPSISQGIIVIHSPGGLVHALIKRMGN